MYINSLHLQHFRNYTDGLFEFAPQSLIVGNNGSGKTTILEAIHLLATTKSFKAAKESHIIQHNQTVALDEAKIISNKNTRSLRLAYFGTETGRVRKLYSINEKKKKASAFIGELFTVLFTTDLLNGFSDKAIIRRKFFNQFLCQLDAEYLYVLAQYEKVIKNKASVLKKVANGADTKELLSWNTMLTLYGAQIIKKRNEFIDAVNIFLQDNHIFDKAITLTYKNIYAPFSEAEIKAKLAWDIVEVGTKEIYAGRCLVGPHRDDYEVYLNNKNIKSFASRGEQKFSLSLLLYAIALYIKQSTNESPVILLDDLQAEMDSIHMNHVLDIFFKTDYQIIMTAITAEPFLTRKTSIVYLS